MAETGTNPLMQRFGVKIADMVGVREHVEEYSVELWRNAKTGRLVIKAFNEGHYNSVEVDLLDVLQWAKDGYQPLVSRAAESADVHDANR